MKPRSHHFVALVLAALAVGTIIACSNDASDGVDSQTEDLRRRHRDAGVTDGATAADASATADANAGVDAGSPPPPPTPIDATGLLTTDRSTAWVPGMIAKGGIPARSTICARVDAGTYGNGAQNASAGIQAAIDACPVGQMVQLSAGTFTVNDYLLIDKGITLRGAGATTTKLQKTNGAVAGVDHGETDAQPIVIVGPNRWPHPNEASAQLLTANGVKGQTAVTVANASAFAQGQLVLVDADEYDAASWLALPPRSGVVSSKIWASDRAVFMLHDPPDDVIDDPFPSSLDWFSRHGRPINEVKEIASVSGNQITFTTPLHIDYPLAKKAQVTGFDSSVVTGAGVESLQVVGGSDGAIRFELAAYSWVSHVEDSVWEGEGIALNHSFRVEVRDSYVHDAAYSTPGGGAYAISLQGGSAEALVENNVVMRANKVMVARSSGAGSVVAYNYMDDGLILYAMDWEEVGINASHMVGSHHVLFEGNESFNYDSDNTHGNAIYMTVFRNHLTGVRRDYPGLGNARAAGLNYGSWWHSFIGNVLGTPAIASWSYENLGTGGASDPFGIGPSIWELGYQSGNWDQAADPKVLSSVIRHGNYDFVTQSTKWDPSIAQQTLPASLYRTTKPDFFGANPWPWVDPITGKLYTLPARARNDAGTPNAP